MKIEIRHAELPDIDLVAGLVARFRMEHSALIGGDSQVAASEVRNEIEAHINSERCGYILGFDRDGAAAGYRRWEDSDGFIFTRELYVIPQYRQMGIARQLIEFTEKWLLEIGQDIACISIVPSNDVMIGLARSMGYTTLNTIEVRKDLTGGGRKPRNQVEAVNSTWEVL